MNLGSDRRGSDTSCGPRQAARGSKRKMRKQVPPLPEVAVGVGQTLWKTATRLGCPTQKHKPMEALVTRQVEGDEEEEVSVGGRRRGQPKVGKKRKSEERERLCREQSSCTERTSS